jgi:propanol-preferring alcohol dehydrogenase
VIPNYFDVGDWAFSNAPDNAVVFMSRFVLDKGIDMLRPGGTCALNGLPPGDFATPIFDVVLKRLTIRGSIVGTRTRWASRPS